MFHAVARSLDRFQHETERGSFRGWLRRITINKLHDQLRFLATGPQAEGGPVHQDRIRELTARQGEFDPEAPAGPDENWLVLRSALNVFRVDFEEATWQAFWGVTIENRSAADVAVDLGITTNAVYKAKSRVLSRMRTELRLLVDLKQLGGDR